MACIEQKTDFNFLNWNKVSGALTLSQLQANGMPSVCDNISPVIPDPPSNLVATAVSSTEIDLTWDAVIGADTYNVYRSTTELGTYTLISSPATNSYNNTGLTVGTIYYYKVSSVQSGSEGALSSAVSAVTIFDLEGGLTFDYVNDYLTVSPINGQAVPEAFIFSYWIEFNNWPIANGALSNLYSSVSGSNKVKANLYRVGTDIRIDGSVFNDSGSLLFNFGNDPIFQFDDYVDGDKIHLLLYMNRNKTLVDGQAYRYRTFINAVEKTSDFGGTIPTTWPSVFGNFLMGSENGSIRFNGNIWGDVYLLTGIPLSQALATTLYGGGNGYNPELVEGGSVDLWLKLDETSGNTASDSSGNSYDATLVNFTPTDADKWKPF